MAKQWTIKPTSLELGIIYITEEGFHRLRARYQDLLYQQRPKISKEVGIAAAHGDRSENAEYQYGKKKLREIDREIYHLQKKFQVMERVTADKFPKDHVGFGSTVTLLDEDGKERLIQLVGEEEIDVELGKISYKSPLGRAIWKKKVGDICIFRPPKGEVEYEITAIN